MSRKMYHEDGGVHLILAQPRAPYDRLPLRVAGFAFYCAVCGIGHEKAKQAKACCKGIEPGINRTESEIFANGRRRH